MSSEPALTTKVFRKIEEISPQDWNIVFPRALENYHFFKSLDESNFDQFKFFYIMVYDSGTAVGAAPCFLMRFPFDITVQGPLKTFLAFLKKPFPNILNPKVLVCGLPMGQGRIGITKDPGCVMEAISDSMEKIAKEERAAGLLFKDFVDSYDSVFSTLIEKGYFRVESLPSTDMDINFSSFDEYLKELSPSSREGLKRKFKKVDGRVKIDLEINDSLTEDELSEVYRLYLQTFQKQEVGIEKLTKDFFRNVSKNMPQEVKYFLWRIEGRPVAFAFCLVSGGHFIDYYLGFDYEVAYQYNLYFVRFRDLLKWCIAHGIKKYEMGVTAYEPKRSLGFEFIRLYFYVKHCNPFVNPFAKLVTHFIKPENFDPVFKEMKRGSSAAVPAAVGCVSGDGDTFLR